MGYNGNNRKLRSSVISKSSLKFGTKLISNVLTLPIALTTSLLFSNSTKENKSIRPINYNNKSNKPPAKLDNTQETYLRYIKNIGFQPSKHISTKRPQIGSYVMRKTDYAVLCVIWIFDNKYTCYDFNNDICSIYNKDELVIH